MDKRWCVYVAYDDAGLPIYVGITVDIRGRMRDHERTSEWYPLHTAMARFPVFNEVVALDIEARLIEWHHPRFNRVGMNRYRSRWQATDTLCVEPPRYLAMRQRDFELYRKRFARFLWLCDVDPRISDIPAVFLTVREEERVRLYDRLLGQEKKLADGSSWYFDFSGARLTER